ncbi:hypothetical protein ABTX99_12520 [Streptomyces flaveolus]|uniref:hypothetical protein n=1 Tax=Streptomyces flaveolus TaxID=67297 RepID=UPI00332990C4
MTLPSLRGLDVDEVAETIRRWQPDLKGITIMADGSIDDSTDEDCATGACPVR